MGLNSISMAILAVPVAVVALVVAFVGIVVRGKSPEERVRVVARVSQWGAWGVVAVWTLGTAKEMYRALFSVSVPVAIEVSPFWPIMPPEVTATPGTARVDTIGLEDGFTQANVHLTGLSSVTRGLIALDMFAQFVAVVILCLLVVRVASGVMRGSVFDSVRARDLVIAGGIFLVSGVTAFVANGWSNMAILNEARPRQISFIDSTWTATATDGFSRVFGFVSWSWSVSAPVWTFVAAALAFVAAMVMRRGSQLETDNQGLI